MTLPQKGPLIPWEAAATPKLTSISAFILRT